jgi:predicted nucleic acid-binding protein
VKRLFQQQDLRFVSGFITILEFECIINNLWKSNEIKLDATTTKLIENLSEYQKVKIMTEFFLKQLPIEILSVSTCEQILINQWTLNVENTLTLAYNLAPNFSLKTIDVIQLASALKIKLFQNRQISYFLTEDKRILNEIEEIRSKIGLIPVSAQELLTALKIQ